MSLKNDLLLPEKKSAIMVWFENLADDDREALESALKDPQFSNNFLQRICAKNGYSSSSKSFLVFRTAIASR